MKIDPKDLKFVPVDPDPDFDPAHNKRVIADTIKASEKLRRKKQRDFEQGVKDRVWVMSKFKKSVEKGKTNSIQEFLGRREIARLKGQSVLEYLQDQANMIGKENLIKKIKRRLNA